MLGKKRENDLNGVLDQMLYQWVKQGKTQRKILRGKLRLGFKPGRLTATRKGVEPSHEEVRILVASLRRAIKAAYFLGKLPAVEKSDLLHWPEHHLLGYRITWEQQDHDKTTTTS